MHRPTEWRPLISHRVRRTRPRRRPLRETPGIPGPPLERKAFSPSGWLPACEVGAHDRSVQGPHRLVWALLFGLVRRFWLLLGEVDE